MIRYFDASALAKHYVRERDTRTVDRLLSGVEAATCRLTEAEVSSALSRRCREGDVTEEGLAMAVTALRADMRRLHVVELSASVVGGVHALLSRHVLRAGDALQLASALVLRDRAGPVELVAYDARLRHAARREGLAVRPKTLRRR
jgi:predicted nucleic acid-binding protein